MRISELSDLQAKSPYSAQSVAEREDFGRTLSRLCSSFAKKAVIEAIIESFEANDKLEEQRNHAPNNQKKVDLAMLKAAKQGRVQ